MTRSTFTCFSSRFLALKTEYLAYQRALHALNRAQAEERAAQCHVAQQGDTHRPQKQSRKDRQREQQRLAADYHGHVLVADSAAEALSIPAKPPAAAPGPAPTALNSITTKRGAPPLPPSDSMSPPLPKRARLADHPHPPSTPDLSRQPATLTPSSAGEAATARGAFPKGCVVWLRNVHEGSSRTTLKGVFARVLERLEEGSGRGVEYADYEKGLETVSRVSSGK